MRFRMLSVSRNKLTRVYFSRNHTNPFSNPNPNPIFCPIFSNSLKKSSCPPPILKSFLISHHSYKKISCLSGFDVRTQVNTAQVRYSCNTSYPRAATRFSGPRILKKSKSSCKPALNVARFQRAVSMLPPRFTAEELCNVITLEEDPVVCLKLFNWASEQPRFAHDVSTYHITIQKLGASRMYQDMEVIVNKVLDDAPRIGSEALFNTVIYFMNENRKLTKAVDIYNHMRNSENAECRPSIRTCNLLFSAFLSRRRNSYINRLYMETMSCLFRQMVNDGVKPDIFALNSMIKGYVLSLHVNEALGIFHQMDTVYSCQPNSFSYDYLIHGLCAQGRTHDARKLFIQMKNKGFYPSSKSYNSLVNSLALGGEIDAAVNFLGEMAEIRRSADLITYETVVGEIWRQRGVGDARRLLKELHENELLDYDIYKKFCNKLGNHRRD